MVKRGQGDVGLHCPNPLLVMVRANEKGDAADAASPHFQVVLPFVIRRIPSETAGLGPPLFDPGRLPRQSAQVVELCTTHPASPDDLNPVNPGGVEQERSLDANPVGRNPTHSKVLIDPARAAADDHTFKDLNSLPIAFDDLGMDAHRVPRAKDGSFTLVLF